jgi:hypothetical protein
MHSSIPTLPVISGSDTGVAKNPRPLGCYAVSTGIYDVSTLSHCIIKPKVHLISLGSSEIAVNTCFVVQYACNFHRRPHT